MTDWLCKTATKLFCHSQQESRAAAKKPRDAAAVLLGFNCHVVSFSL